MVIVVEIVLGCGNEMCETRQSVRSGAVSRWHALHWVVCCGGIG
jgi:hypothetical protein